MFTNQKDVPINIIIRKCLSSLQKEATVLMEAPKKLRILRSPEYVKKVTAEQASKNIAISFLDVVKILVINLSAEINTKDAAVYCSNNKK